MSSYKSILKSPLRSNVEKEDAENAIKTLIKWIGDDPEREGLVDTPKRVIKVKLLLGGGLGGGGENTIKNL